jgi:hypothetical protein
MEEEKPTILELKCLIESPEEIRSPSSGIINMLPACSDPCQRERDTPQIADPEIKFSVPSMGSKTATQPESSSGSKLNDSSPRNSKSSNSPTKRSRMPSSRNKSALLTGLPSLFQEKASLNSKTWGRLLITKFATLSIAAWASSD